MHCTNTKREYALDISFRSQSPIKLECIARIVAKREYALDISFRSQQWRIKLDCVVRILSVSTRLTSHSALSNPESILSVLYEYLKHKHTLDVSFWSLSRIKLECMVRILSVSTRWMSYSVSIANQANVYCTNIKREYTLDVSFWSQSRIKAECIARIMSVSARYISHCGLNRESSLSLWYEY